MVNMDVEGVRRGVWNVPVRVRVAWLPACGTQHQALTCKPTLDVWTPYAPPSEPLLHTCAHTCGPDTVHVEKDMLRGDECHELRLRLKQHRAEKFPYTEDD